MYVGSEHFMFSAPRSELDDPALAQVDAHVGWTRIGPWLPWMEMGGVEGRLLYVGQGNKKASIGDLPADIQERIRKDYPESPCTFRMGRSEHDQLDLFSA